MLFHLGEMMSPGWWWWPHNVMNLIPPNPVLKWLEQKILCVFCHNSVKNFNMNLSSIKLSMEFAEYIFCMASNWVCFAELPWICPWLWLWKGRCLTLKVIENGNGGWGTRRAAYGPSLSSAHLPCSWVMEVQGQEVKVQNWRWLSWSHMVTENGMPS